MNSDPKHPTKSDPKRPLESEQGTHDIAAPIMMVPIGVARTSFHERAEVPRQASLIRDVEARLELYPMTGFEDALSDIETWSHLWVLFAFDRAKGFRPKVEPPRSREKRGLFATRAPYRPNPIGMSAVKLLGRDGLTLFVSGLDVLDGTPILDIKPYVTYADAIGDAEGGWLAGAFDPDPGYTVELASHVVEQLRFLREEHAIDLAERIIEVLSVSPFPHAYRRIRADGDGFRLAIKEWRARFRVEGRLVTVVEVMTGYKASALLGDDPQLEPHRAFVARFGA